MWDYDMATRNIPSRSLDATVKINEDGSLDVKVLILSGNEMYRDYEGDFVIDLETVALHKEKLIVDYNHDESEVLGYIKNLRYEDGGLWGDAHLFSTRPGDRAEEVILRITEGTPYEISPTVSFSEGQESLVGDGETVTVNGRAVDGPATLFTNTPVRGVSICPYGTDKLTGITTLKLERAGDKKMIEEKKPEVAHPDLEEMIDAFGEVAGLAFYRRGLSMEEAEKEDYEELKAQRAKLSEEEEKKDELSNEEEKNEELSEEEEEKKGELAATKSQLSKLKASLAKLSAEVDTLRAIFRRGDPDPVNTQPKPGIPDNRSAVFRMADKIKASGINRQ